MKTCTKCGLEKSFSEFGKHKEGANGLRPYCKQCHRDGEKARRLANPEMFREKDRIRGVKERARRNATAYNWSINNPAKRKISRAKWGANNPDKRCMYAAVRRVHVSQGTPAWSNVDAISAIYEKAAEIRKLGVNCHVDHIVPLKSPIVCGLHTEANLQLLLADENIAKGNRYWPDMP